MSVANNQQPPSTEKENQRTLLFHITLSGNRILLLNGSVPKESLQARETSRKTTPNVNPGHDPVRVLTVHRPLQETLQGTTDFLFLGMSALLP